MVQLSFLRVTAGWAMATALFHCLFSSCGANYLRDATPMARELQSLPTIDDIVFADSNLTTLAAAFEAAQLVGALCTNCNYTAFAPTNDAFAALDQEFLTTLLTPSWILHLQNLLAFHATLPTDDGNRLLSTNYVDGQIFEMLNSEQVTVRDLKSGITLTSPLTVGSKIVEADILASNGAVQKVNTVFSPGFFGVDVFALGESIVEFTILQELMDVIGLAGTEGEFTILAPTNAAFLSLGNETLVALKEDKEALGNILANHVIVGVYPSIFWTNGLVLESLGGLNITVTVSEVTARQADTPTIMFNDATVILADILAKNGIVYAIDTVLIDADPVSDVPSILSSDVPSDAPSSIPSDAPSSFPSNVPSDAPSDFPTSIVSLFENLSEIDPEFSVLDDLFGLTGLGDLEGEFTLLAPENDAWSALGNDTFARLQNNVAVLESLLRNHIVPGTVSPEDLIGGGVLTTLGGETVTVTAPAAGSDFAAAQQTTSVFIFNDASSSDIFYAGNGIIYKIDALLFDPVFPIASDLPAPAPVPLPITPPVSLPITPPVSVPITPPVPLPITPPISLPITPSVSLPITPPAPLPITPPVSSPITPPAPAQIPVTEPPVEPNIPTELPANESTPVPAAISASPSSSPMVAPDFCIDFTCGDGYELVSDAATRPGNDRATCCFFAGVCAGAPVGAMCSLGDIESSLIPNPSFEEFSLCPDDGSQLSFSTSWEQATTGTSDYFIGSPTCSDSWFRSGAFEELGSIPQNATDGDAFVGSIKLEGYHEYIGACLNSPIVVGTEYTFTLNLAAANGDFIFGGDTNGETDLLCIPACGLFPIAGIDYKGNDFEILSTAAPEGGLVGGGDWKTIAFNFVATSNCSAIMFGPSISQTVDVSQLGSYIIYDFLNLQEGTAGMCNADGECVPVASSPTLTPAPSTQTTDPPFPTPTTLPLPTFSPADAVVTVEDYFISFVAPEAEREPTPAEYDEMRVRINGWFEMQVLQIYDDSTVQLLRAETSLNSTNYGFENGIPPRPFDFNIYMDFASTKYTFTGNSTTVPTPAEILGVMQDSITTDFILSIVRTFFPSPFETTNEVFLSERF